MVPGNQNIPRRVKSLGVSPLKISVKLSASVAKAQKAPAHSRPWGWLPKRVFINDVTHLGGRGKVRAYTIRSK